MPRPRNYEETRTKEKAERERIRAALRPIAEAITVGQLLIGIAGLAAVGITMLDEIDEEER